LKPIKSLTVFPLFIEKILKEQEKNRMMGILMPTKR